MHGKSESTLNFDSYFGIWIFSVLWFWTYRPPGQLTPRIRHIVDIWAELFRRAFFNAQVKLNKCKCNALGSTQLNNKINIIIPLQGSWPRDSEDIYMDWLGTFCISIPDILFWVIWISLPRVLCIHVFASCKVLFYISLYIQIGARYYNPREKQGHDPNMEFRRPG